MFQVSSHGSITRVRMAKSALGRRVHEVSAYLIGDLLIDTGPPATSSRLVELCRERRVSRVVLTHHHEDHTGGAAAIREALGLPILAPPGALQILLEGARVPFYRRMVWGTPRRVRAEPLGQVLEHHDLRFEVIPTPGHAFDHVCLFEPERGWLVSGDLYVHERVKFLRCIEDVAEHLRSLRRVASLDPERLLCGHAGIVPEARKALEGKIAYWEELGERARDLAREGLAVKSITERLLGREEFLTWVSLGDFSKQNLVRALLKSG